MQEDTIKDIINDAHKLATADCDASSLRFGIEGIAMRLEELQRGTSAAKKDDCKLKMPVISMPGKAAIKYHVDDPELPRLAASIETIKSESGKVSCDCTLYAGNEVLADMQVYRGKSYALAMVRRALKGAMSKLGKHRRMTANRQSREAAKKEEK